MNTLKNNTLHYINDSNFVLCNSNVDKLINYNNSNLSIIYFTNNLKNSNSTKLLLNNSFVDRILVVSDSKNKFKNKKLTFCSKITASTLNSLTHNILILIDINDNYDFLKFVINNLKLLLNLSKKLGINLHHSYNGSSAICAIISNNSIYFNDLLNCIKVILINNSSKQYEFIYDTVCDYLDSQFHNCNLCDFKNDQCVANRAGRCCKHTTMGCCYSFDYASIYEPRLVKNVKLCKYMKNKSCSTSNISCKLFTCTYLREKNIKFDTRKILLLDCFFNSKQHEVIRSNFFRSREEILNKLLEKNHDTYLWFYMFRKYAIKN